MYCYKCGNKIVRKDAAFCVKCGASLKALYETEGTEAGKSVTQAAVNTDDSQSSTEVVPKKHKPRFKFNGKKFLKVVIALAVIFVIVKSVSLLTSKVGQIDITHGGEKKWISDVESDWIYDYDWAELDEEWDGFDKDASLKMGFDLLTGSSDLGDDIQDSIGRDYIEERLNPAHYSADSYFDFCPKKSVRNAKKQWEKYLKDHKKLKKMYIVVNGEKMFPYADDDFDKSYFINDDTAYPDIYDDYDIFGSDDTAKRFCISMYLAEDLDDLEAKLYGYGLSELADVIEEERLTVQSEQAPVMGCHYFYPEDDETACNALLFVMNYLGGTIYENEDATITASQDSDGAYLLGYNIEYDWYQE